MYKNKYFILLSFILLIHNSLCSQNNDPMQNSSMLYVEKISQPYYTIEEPIDLYLDDTDYFVQKDIEQILYESQQRIGFFKYFISTYATEFELKDSLPDGFYCLYNLTRKQAEKIKDKDIYLVASGGFKNKMKQGYFSFYSLSEDNFKKVFKTIHFVNDTINGIVKELVSWEPIYLAEYKMGIKDGFSFYANNGNSLIILYKEGEIIKQTSF